MTVTDSLRRVPLFRNVPPDDLARLAQGARQRTASRNAVLVFEDEPGDALYVITRGRAKVVLIGDDGREVILAVLNPGDAFGEMALVDGQPRSAHVIAMEDCELLALRRDEFRALVARSPELALALLAELSGRLRAADGTIQNLVLLDVNGRVARLLLDLADRTGGDHIARHLTHQTIAQLVGSSRETVSRTLRDFQARGLIDVSREAIRLRSRDGLLKEARRPAKPNAAAPS